VTITRTVAYDRTEDVLVVWDRLTSEKSVRASQQWGLARTRGVTVEADAVHSTGPGANVSMLFTTGGAPLDLAVGQRKPMRGWNSESYGELSPAPSVRATQRGTDLSWLTVIAPRAADVPATSVSATSAVSADAAATALTSPNGSALLTLDRVGGARSAFAPVAPSMRTADDIVLAGTTTTLRATGLPPSAPVAFQVRPVGQVDWTVAGQAAASAAGTAEVPVSVPVTADFRVAAGSGVSGESRVTAAVAPAAPLGVTATPSAGGAVTVQWQPPLDTGGAPLTRYVVVVDGRRMVLSPSATSLVVPGVVAGPRVVSVRTRNAVARSPWATVPVNVAPYPSVTAPRSVPKKTTVTLGLRGLLPDVRSTVELTGKKGGVRTRRVTADDDGTATLRVTLRTTTRVVATSGDVRSAVRKIRVR